jgi:hypothetical protein
MIPDYLRRSFPELRDAHVTHRPFRIRLSMKAQVAGLVTAVTKIRP